jgi:hypothetical protein
MTIRYIDLYGGNDSAAGTSWGTAWKTINNTSGQVWPGDEVRISKTPTPTHIGNATWTNLSSIVTLQSSLTLAVDYCETVWTAVNASSTQRTTITRKQGTYSEIITKTNPSTNTRYAYQTLPSVTDYSSYNAITFWCKNYSGGISSNYWKLCLCSDTLGVTAVDEFIIPSFSGSSEWRPLELTRAGGGALGSSIRSVALYTGTGIPVSGIYGIYLDNINACNTASLSLTKLISRKSDLLVSSSWHVIQNISGSTVRLDTLNSTTPANTNKGYSGPSGNSSTFILETYKTTGNSNSVYGSGTLGSPLVYSGGWNTTTGIQDGETYLDGELGDSYGLNLNPGLTTQNKYVEVEKISTVRYNVGYYIPGCNFVTIRNCTSATGCTTGVQFLDAAYNHIQIQNTNNNQDGIVVQSNTPSQTYGKNNITVFNSSNCSSAGVAIYNSTGNTLDIRNVVNNGGLGLYCVLGFSNTFNITKIENNGGSGVLFTNSNNNRLSLSSSLGNSTYGIFFSESYDNIVYGATILDITPVALAGNSIEGRLDFINCSFTFPITSILWGVNNRTTRGNSKITSQNHNLSGDNKIYVKGGEISTEDRVSPPPGESPKQWKFTFDPDGYTITSVRNSSFPLKLDVGKVYCPANVTRTISTRMKKDHATNVIGRLVVPGRQIAGVDNSVIATLADNTTEQTLTISFTPTESGLVEVQAWAEAINGYDSVYYIPGLFIS